MIKNYKKHVFDGPDFYGESITFSFDEPEPDYGTGEIEIKEVRVLIQHGFHAPVTTKGLLTKEDLCGLL